ncbi:MAG: hypothetical protein ACTSU4_01530 [Promethearchaeota archaeon]
MKEERGENSERLFIRELNEARKLMQKDRYGEAIKILDKLKKIEREGDFDYNLTHSLYQLDSNARSLYNQKILLNILNEFSHSRESISFEELNHYVREKKQLIMDNSLIKREIEILILRGEFPGMIRGESIIFSQNPSNLHDKDL